MLKRAVQTCVMLIALVVLCYSAYRIYMIQRSYSEGVSLYQEVQDQAVQIDTSGDASEEELPGSGDADGNQKDTKEKKQKQEKLVFPKASVDFAYLEKVNPDICGWIFLEDSVISYPVVQAEDNEFYLTKSYNKSSSAFGSIFLDMRNANDFKDHNTIIYGHNMKNGSMFGSLKRYQEKNYYQNHKYFYIFTKDQMYRYEVCSAYTTTAGSDVYTTQYDTAEDWLAYEQKALGYSLIDTNVSLGEEDQIITLSTCHGVHTDNRFIVQAKLVAKKGVEGKK